MTVAYAELPARDQLYTSPCPYRKGERVSLMSGNENPPLRGVVIDTRHFEFDGWQVMLSLDRGAQTVWMPASMVVPVEPLSPPPGNGKAGQAGE